MSDNDEQKELWNGWLGQGFLSVEDYIDKIIQPISTIALETVGAREGDNILDVGCGGGGTSIFLSRTAARVFGVDISEKMIDQAISKSTAIPNLSFCVADAASYKFEKDFDHVFSRFGVMFFSDPIGAFSNLRDAIVPNGKITFVCWQSPSKNEWINISAEAIKEFQPPDFSPPDPRSPGGFAFADKDYIEEILDAASFEQIQINPLNVRLNMGKSIDEVLFFYEQVGPLSNLLAGMGSDGPRKDASNSVRESIKKRMNSQGLELEASAWLVTAETKS
tara:strand:- start:2556 stop:3389 length:834 start_codon:yes stop_codon:yes gene_type:complete